MSNADVISRAEHEAILAERNAALADRDTMIEELRDKVFHLEHIAEKFQQMLFGRRSEKRFIDAETGAIQGILFEGDEETSPDPVVPATEKPKTKRKRRGPRFGAHLERIVVEQKLEGEEAQCSCCGKELHSIGVEKSQKLEIVPSTARVIEILRHKYACSCKQAGVKTAPAYPTAFAKSVVTDETRAYLVVQKFVDHVPCYRQAKILARNGVDISDETIGRYIRETADLLEPIAWAMRAELLASNYLQADETTLPVLKAERAKPGAHRAYLWSYGIPWSTVVFDYQLTRSGRHATEFLRDFQGVLQSDRYAGYNAVRKREDIIDVACWAHARRKFKEAELTSGRRTRSILTKIGKLYAIEKKAREEKLDPEGRTLLRVKHAIPVLRELHDELAKHAVTVRPSTPLGKAIEYTHSNWYALTEYVERGGVEIDTNLLENSIRPIALGRKNYLFAGSPAGAEAAATLYSITESCRRIGINPLTYLTHVLRQLATQEWTEELILSLRPYAWAMAQASETRTL